MNALIRENPSSTIPNYALYGVDAQPAWENQVHYEQIHERSCLHDYKIAPHVHSGLFQLLYVQHGGGETFIDDMRWAVRPGSLIVVPARSVHSFDFSADIDGPVVTAAQRPLESLAAVASPELLTTIRTPAVVDTTLSPRHAQALMPLFEAVERESRVHAAGHIAAGTALLVALFVQIERLSTYAAPRPGETRDSRARSRKSTQIEKFRALVDTNFRKRLPISQYAQQLGITAGQLNRLCQDTLGMSSLDVLNARIIHEAQRELAYSTSSIKQIAAILGFADEAYFGRLFRKQTGDTPSEFRRMALLRLGQNQANQLA